MAETTYKTPLNAKMQRDFEAFYTHRVNVWIERGIHEHDAHREARRELEDAIAVKIDHAVRNVWQQRSAACR